MPHTLLSILQHTVHLKTLVKIHCTTDLVIPPSHKLQDLQTKTELVKLCCIKVFFDLERLSNSLSDNGVTRVESSEVIFVILLEVVLPTGRGFPDCLISHINHTLFITITRAVLCAAVASALEGNSMRKSV